jgi:YVTN family beta-propeller protein
MRMIAFALLAYALSAAPERGASCEALARARLAVVSQDDGSVSVIDPQSNSVVARAKIGPGAAGIAASPDGRLLYVTYPDGAAINIVDAETLVVLRRLSFKGEPFGIAAALGSLFVSDWANGTVTRLDAASGAQTGAVAVGKSPAHMAISADGHRLYVADRESGDVAVIGADAMSKIASIPAGEGPFALALAPDDRRLYVANVRGNDLAVIDTARLEQVARIVVGVAPYGVAVTPDGASVLVTNQHGDSLSIVDARSGAVIGAIPVGRYPEGVVAGPFGLAYVANWFSGDVSIVDLAQRREIHRIKVGEGPRSFALLPAALSPGP